MTLRFNPKKLYIFKLFEMKSPGYFLIFWGDFGIFKPLFEFFGKINSGGIFHFLTSAMILRA
jgi:hypothetical protein